METTLRSAAQKRNLKIGCAVATHLLDDPEYARILGAEFNLIEPENDLKFGPVHPEKDQYNFAPVERQIAFAQSHNQEVRGHTLTWHNQNAPWIEGKSPDELNQILKDHIFTVMHHFKGQIKEWDVVNEAINDEAQIRKSIWYNEPGIGLADQNYEYIAQSFRWAHEADPDAKLFYNDYNIEKISSKSDRTYEMLKQLLSEGVPIYGIGFQCHFVLGSDFDEAFETFQSNIQRFKSLGLEIQFTELDIRMTEPQPGDFERQAEAYKKTIELALEEGVTLIQLWGFSDRHSWIPYTFKSEGWALPWDENFKMKPAYHAILAALQGDN